MIFISLFCDRRSFVFFFFVPSNNDVRLCRTKRWQGRTGVTYWTKSMAIGEINDNGVWTKRVPNFFEPRQRKRTVINFNSLNVRFVPRENRGHDTNRCFGPEIDLSTWSGRSTIVTYPRVQVIVASPNVFTFWACEQMELKYIMYKEYFVNKKERKKRKKRRILAFQIV